MDQLQDTIVAIATPVGAGGVGIVRLSGPDAIRILAALARREEATFESHKMRLLPIFRPNSEEVLDRALTVAFLPHSHIVFISDIVSAISRSLFEPGKSLVKKSVRSPKQSTGTSHSLTISRSSSICFSVKNWLSSAIITFVLSARAEKRPRISVLLSIAVHSEESPALEERMSAPSRVSVAGLMSQTFIPRSS